MTIARIVMIPFFVAFLMYDIGVGKSAGKWIALAVFIIASLTDTLDGYLARRDNLVTNFGKFMDPLADKLLVCSALICFTGLGELPACITIIIIAREFIISGFRLVAADNGIVIAASYWGKFKTVSQMIMIILAIMDIQKSGIPDPDPFLCGNCSCTYPDFSCGITLPRIKKCIEYAGLKKEKVWLCCLGRRETYDSGIDMCGNRVASG